MDDLGKLVLFRDVVELGGFTAAAAKWQLNHSTVSKHIKTLERRLQVQLLHRTSRTMKLTPSGEVVHEHGRRIGSTFDEMVLRLEELRGQVSGELRIGSLLHIGQHLLQPTVERFVAAYPSVRVTLLLQDEPLAFYRNALDLALTVGLPSEGSLIARRVLENPVCLAAAPALIERAGPLSHPSELTDYPTVAYASAEAEITTWAYTDGDQERTVTVRPVMTTSDGNSLLDAVRRGLGVGYLSAFSARDDIAAGRLVQVLPEYALPPYAPVYLLSAPAEYTSPTLEAFKATLMDVAHELTRGV